MAEPFIERIERWKHEAKRELRKHWWGLAVLFLIGLVEHRIFEAGNRFIDNHRHLYELKPVFSVLASRSIIQPALLALTLFLLGLFALLAHAYWTTRARQPDVIEVRLKELYRTPKDRYSEIPFDLFLLVRLELKEKLATSALAYRFELSMNGIYERLEAKSDLDQWVLRTWTADTVLEYPLNPLPSNLSLGEPVEGWVHCLTTPVTGKRLEEYGIRFVVQSAHNANYAEHEADPLIWNPRRDTLVARKW